MNITVKLPDGSTRAYDRQVAPAQVAEDISEDLARAAVAAVVDGKTCDLACPLPAGTCEMRIVTEPDEEALEVLRHTTAHVLAQAVVTLYGPEVRYTIGPPLTDDFQYGFYYDFDLPEAIGTEDLPRIEAEMRKIVAQEIPIERIELPVDQARAEFERLGQGYKVEMIDDLVAAEGIESISLYRQGDFLDMCRGPHLPHTGRVRAFKLLATAGAYWRGDESKKMLTRVYGTAFFDEKAQAEHLAKVQEARKRDHRVLGKQLGLFMLSDSVGAGLPLWLPKGTVIRMELEGWLRGELIKRGYQAVITPHIGKLGLYRTSGHYPYYEHGLFPAMPIGDDDGYLLKPMNCPHHIEIYRAAQHSYRELPIRLSEFGTVYRFEASGQLSGLTRVRGFTQDDAHIFCTPEQLEAEIESCVDLTRLILETLSLDDYRVRIGLRDPDSAKYTGSSDIWDLAERNIRNVVKRLGMDYAEEPGEATFYGPKIDFVVKDCLGRDWQLGTIQVDYNLPERFDLEYVGPDNALHRPVMIHRAPLGSPERFVGILIEHFAGALPLWLAPVQLAVLPVSDKFNQYARSVVETLAADSIRVELDDSPEKIGAKIRKATLAKVPYMAVVGRREVEAEAVALRHRTAGDRGAMALDDLLAGLRKEIRTKGKQCPLGPPDQ